MVQQIENWSTVRGRVREVREDPERPGFLRVLLEVTGVAPVPDYARAVDAAAVGTSVLVAVPREGAGAGVREGEEAELRVRTTPRGLFAAP